EHVEGAALGIRKHARYARPTMQRGAGGGGILIDPDDAVTFALCIIAAERHLVANRTGILQIGRESGVDRGASHSTAAAVSRVAWSASSRAWSSLAWARARASSSLTTAGSSGSRSSLWAGRRVMEVRKSAYRSLLPARRAPTVPRIRLSQSSPP